MRAKLVNESLNESIIDNKSSEILNFVNDKTYPLQFEYDGVFQEGAKEYNEPSEIHFLLAPSMENKYSEDFISVTGVVIILDDAINPTSFYWFNNATPRPIKGIHNQAESNRMQGTLSPSEVDIKYLDMLPAAVDELWEKQN